MHYLVRFRTERLADVESVAGQEGVYISPEGEQGWAIREAEGEESLRRDLEGQEVEEVQPMLPGREYLAVRNARRELWRTSSHASWTIPQGPWQKPAGPWAGSWRPGVTRRRSVRTKPRGPARML
jgi:hypothetical protein